MHFLPATFQWSASVLVPLVLTPWGSEASLCDTKSDGSDSVSAAPLHPPRCSPSHWQPPLHTLTHTHTGKTSLLPHPLSLFNYNRPLSSCQQRKPRLSYRAVSYHQRHILLSAQKYCLSAGEATLNADTPVKRVWTAAAGTGLSSFKVQYYTTLTFASCFPPTLPVSTR